jgi:hypothetical protein
VIIGREERGPLKQLLNLSLAKSRPNLSLTRRVLEALVRRVRQGAGPPQNLASLADG